MITSIQTFNRTGSSVSLKWSNLNVSYDYLQLNVIIDSGLNRLINLTNSNSIVLNGFSFGTNLSINIVTYKNGNEMAISEDYLTYTSL